MTVSDLVARRAAQAREVGMDGLVCAGKEVAKLRSIVKGQLTLVVPGVRPAGSAVDEQKRTMTPAAAIAAGADYIVVGRPIITAAEPKAAAQAIVAEIAAAAK
jgi:orotidine-5'-phosphate decarboxylase